jgi:hypothetical protein
MTTGCTVLHLYGNYLFRLPPVTLEWLSPKMPRKKDHFNVYLYLRFDTLLPEHHVQAIVVHVLHSLVRRNQSPSKFCVRSQMFYRCQYCTTAALPFPLQKPFTKCKPAYSSSVNVLGILTMTALQHNVAKLA